MNCHNFTRLVFQNLNLLSYWTYNKIKFWVSSGCNLKNLKKLKNLTCKNIKNYFVHENVDLLWKFIDIIWIFVHYSYIVSKEVG